MELKLFNLQLIKVTTELLIVPYGIETRIEFITREIP